VIGVAALGTAIGMRWPVPADTPPAIVASAPPSAAAPAPTAGRPQDAAPAGTTATPEGPPVVFTPGRAETAPWGLIFTIGFIAAGLGVYRLSIPPPRHERDSAEFTSALRNAVPALITRTPTPRAIKRFLNRVRYYAMQQRSVSAPVGRVDEWREWITARLSALRRRGASAITEARTSGDPAGATAIDAEALPEHVLVALGVVQQVRPGWLQEDGFWQDPAAHAARDAEAPIDADTLAHLGDAERYRKSFTALSAGVHVH
jgi:hypothetical protein